MNYTSGIQPGAREDMLGVRKIKKCCIKQAQSSHQQVRTTLINNL